MSWVARAMVLDPGHVYDANIFAPHKNTLAFSEANIPAGILGLPAWWLTRNPYATYNSAVCLSLLLAALVTFGLVTHLTGSRDAAAVAAILFAFAPFVTVRYAHIQLLMTSGLPLSLWALHRFTDRPTLWRALAVSLAVASRRPVVRLLRLLLGDRRRPRHGLLRGQSRPVAPAGLLGPLPPGRRWRGAGDPAVLHPVPGPRATRRAVPHARRCAAVFRHVAVVPVLDRAPAPPRDWVGPAVQPGRLPRAGAVPGVLRVRTGRHGRRHGAVARPETLPAIADIAGRAPRHETVGFYVLLSAVAAWFSLGPERLALHCGVPTRAWLVPASRTVPVRNRRDAGLHGPGGGGPRFLAPGVEAQPVAHAPRRPRRRGRRGCRTVGHPGRAEGASRLPDAGQPAAWRRRVTSRSSSGRSTSIATRSTCCIRPLTGIPS